MLAKPILTFAGLMLLTSTGLAQSDHDQSWNSDQAIAPNRTTIAIRDQVKISAEVPGRIIMLDPPHVGDTVEAGQIIVKIDDSVQQAQLRLLEVKADDEAAIEAAEDKRDLAEIELDDKKKRNELAPGAYSETEIRRLELEFKRAGSELKKALHDRKVALEEVNAKKVELQQYTVRTSMGGRVESLNFHSVGSSVRQGDPIVEIVNLDKVIAELYVSVDQYARVQIGDTVLLRKVLSGGNAEPNRASDGGIFKTSVNKRKPQLSAFRPSTPQKVITFVGRVTHFRNDAQTDDDNSVVVVAVVENQMSGPGKHALRQGVRVDARIIPSN